MGKSFLHDKQLSGASMSWISLSLYVSSFRWIPWACQFCGPCRLLLQARLENLYDFAYVQLREFLRCKCEWAASGLRTASKIATFGFLWKIVNFWPASRAELRCEFLSWSLCAAASKYKLSNLDRKILSGLWWGSEESQRINKRGRWGCNKNVLGEKFSRNW